MGIAIAWHDLGKPYWLNESDVIAEICQYMPVTTANRQLPLLQRMCLIARESRSDTSGFRLCLTGPGIERAEALLAKGQDYYEYIHCGLKETRDVVRVRAGNGGKRVHYFKKMM